MDKTIAVIMGLLPSPVGGVGILAFMFNSNLVYPPDSSYPDELNQRMQRATEKWARRTKRMWALSWRALVLIEVAGAIVLIVEHVR